MCMSLCTDLVVPAERMPDVKWKGQILCACTLFIDMVKLLSQREPLTSEGR